MLQVATQSTFLSGQNADTPFGKYKGNARIHRLFTNNVLRHLHLHHHHHHHHHQNIDMVSNSARTIPQKSGILN